MTDQPTGQPYEIDDLVTATFRPTITGDLTEYAPPIGSSIMVEASWVYEYGPYTGQLAWTPWPEDEESFFGFSVPTCDLADVVMVERGTERSDRR